MAAPRSVPIPQFLTPVTADLLLIERVSSVVAGNERLEPGTRYTGTTKEQHEAWSGAVFLGQRAIDGTDSDVLRIWASAPVRENLYNYLIDFSGDAVAAPIFTRRYLVLRDDYIATKPAALSLYSGVFRVRVTAGGSGYDENFDVTATGGGGSGFTGTAIVNADGEVEHIVVTAEGTGYTSAPTIVLSAGDGSGATATAVIQSSTCYLVKEETEEAPAEWKSLYLVAVRTYETLPGPWIPDRDYDPLLGPVQVQRRAVANTGQVAGTTPTTETTYKGRDGSSIVSWEIVRTFTDGTGAPGAATNPAFPVVEGPLVDDPNRGPVHSHSQLVPIVWKVTAAMIASGGTGGTNGTQTVTGTTGTGTKFQASVTVSGGAITAIGSISTAGAYTIRPTTITAEPVTGASLTGATLSLTLEPTVSGGASIANGVYTDIAYQPYGEFHLKKVTTYFAVPAPAQSGSVQTGKKQYGTLSKQVVVASTATADTGATVESSSVQPIDDLIATKQTVTIPSVLALTQSGTRQNDVIPREYKTITSISTTESSAAGTQSLTALGSSGIGVISSQVSAEDAFQSRKQDTTVSGSVASSLSEYGKNEYDQLVTIAKSTGVGSSPSISSLTESARVAALGDGVFETTLGTVGELFDARSISDEPGIDFPMKFLAGGMDETISQVIAATAATPDTLSSNGIGIIAADAQRVSAVKVRKRTTTRTGTPSQLTGYDFDEATGLLLPTVDEVVSAGTAGTPMDSSGNYSEIRPLNTVWSIRSTRKSTALTSRSYTKAEHVSLPRVLTFFTQVTFTNAGGFFRKGGFYHELKDFSGAYVITVTETWQSTPFSGLSITNFKPTGFSWLTPFSDGSIPPCMHGAILIAGTTGTSDPDWGYNGWSYYFPATSPTTISGVITISDTQQPWRGGYLRSTETITV